MYNFMLNSILFNHKSCWKFSWQRPKFSIKTNIFSMNNVYKWEGTINVNHSMFNNFSPSKNSWKYLNFQFLIIW